MSTEIDTWIKTLKDGNILSDIDDSWKNLDELLKRGLSDAGARTIQTKFGESVYKTSLALDNDITNEFPLEHPQENDVYWKRHNEIVDTILETRKEIILKVIETVGITIKGVINPITVSNIDIAKIIEGIPQK